MRCTPHTDAVNRRQGHEQPAAGFSLALSDKANHNTAGISHLQKPLDDKEVRI